MSLIKETLRKQRNYVDTISSQESIGKAGLWFNWIWCYVRYGATPSDWFCYEMWKYRHCQLRKIITRRKNIELDKIFNPREFARDFDEKQRFNEIYNRFVKRQWRLLTPPYAKNTMLQVFSGEVVVKPLNLSSGRGIFTYNISAQGLDGLVNAIGSTPHLIEEKVELVPELKALNPPSCNTIRVYTMVRKDGAPEILDAVIRVGGGETIQDNFHAKGVVYPIDLKTGRIKGAGRDLQNNEYIIHPSTHIYMPGYQIPMWNDVLEFAKEAAAQNPKARFIGWDIAVTPKGCEMIKGNYYVYCGLMQIFDKEGKYNLVKSFK